MWHSVQKEQEQEQDKESLQAESPGMDFVRLGMPQVNEQQNQCDKDTHVGYQFCKYQVIHNGTQVTSGGLVGPKWEVANGNLLWEFLNLIIQ